MLNIPSTQSIFLHTRPTDMRKGFDGLSGLVREAFDADPLDGSLFLFVSSRFFSEFVARGLARSSIGAMM